MEHVSTDKNKNMIQNIGSNIEYNLVFLPKI